MNLPRQNPSDSLGCCRSTFICLAIIAILVFACLFGFAMVGVIYGWPFLP